MKKGAAIFITLFATLSCFAQNPDPLLFQTWYLNFFQSSDAGMQYVISNIDPPIFPYITIEEDLTFVGQGACNSYNGVYNATSSNSELTAIEFTNTTEDCGIQTHNSFENEYFDYINFGGWYSISAEGDDWVLIINNPVFGQAIYGNFPLSTPEFDVNSIKVFPNPTNSSICIQPNQITITKVEIFNYSGQLIKTKHDNYESIDISQLDSGVYIMNIYTELGIVNKKIIKQ